MVKAYSQRELERRIADNERRGWYVINQGQNKHEFGITYWAKMGKEKDS